MRRLTILAVVAFASVLTSQPAVFVDGLTVNQVSHEAGADECGTFLAGIQIPNPAFDSLQPTGQPEFLPFIGKGKGLQHVDSVSPEFYALAGTTTHDLFYLSNTSGADVQIDLDPGSAGHLVLTQIRPIKSPELAPEGASPDPVATSSILFGEGAALTGANCLVGVSGGAVSVPNGSTVMVGMLKIKWGRFLDTSPRDYILTFEFTEVSGGVRSAFEAKMTVPKSDSQESGCVANDSSIPRGLLVVVGGGMAAMVTRRKLLRSPR